MPPQSSGLTQACLKGSLKTLQRRLGSLQVCSESLPLLQGLSHSRVLVLKCLHL
jgi:hypothetical protein